MHIDVVLPKEDNHPHSIMSGGLIWGLHPQLASPRLCHLIAEHRQQDAGLQQHLDHVKATLGDASPREVWMRTGFTMDYGEHLRGIVVKAGWEDVLSLPSDRLGCRLAAGKHIPAEIKAVAEELLFNAMHGMMRRYVNKDRVEMLSLTSGRLLQHILHTMERPDGALHLYSAHDTTLAPLLMCVMPEEEFKQQSWPGFCSNLTFELWSENNDVTELSVWSCHGSHFASRDSGKHVRAIYNGRPLPMSCGRTGICTLEEFRAMALTYDVANYAKAGQL